MTRSELIDALYRQQPHLGRADVEAGVRAVLKCMVKSLTSGERIEARGFGSFSLRHRSARQGRNPKTGEPVALPEQYAVHFKPGQTLRDRVNPSPSRGL